MRLYKSLVVSVLTYRCERWTLKAEFERRIAAFEVKFFRRTLKISYRDHVTNISVMQAIAETAGPQEPLLATVKRLKLQWFGLTTRHNTFAKEILQGAIKGGRKRGRPQQNLHRQHSIVYGSRATGIMQCCPQPSQMEKDLCGSLQARTPTIGPVKG